MSQHSGGRRARHPISDKPGRPSLERPSLFAGMDDEPSRFDGDTQRVRILSTLESTRRPARGPMKIHGVTRKKRGAWQGKALIGLMLIGVLSVLASFVMVLLNGHAAVNKAEAIGEAQRGPILASKPPITTSMTARVDAANPLAALIAPQPKVAVPTPAAALATGPTLQQAAVIENIAIGPTPGVLSAAKAGAAVAAAKPDGLKVAMADAKPTPLVLAPHSVVLSSTQATDGAKSIKPETPTVRRAAANNRNDEDVALLEAMFAHTRPRPAAIESAADEIKRRCNGLNGADAATCRARVCVQNPTAAVCHPD